MKRKDLQTHLQDKKDYHLERSMDVVMQLSMGQSEVSATVSTMATGGAKCGISHIPAPFHPWLQNTPTCYPHPPWVMKMKGFQEKKEKNEGWFSDPVYSHRSSLWFNAKCYRDTVMDLLDWAPPKVWKETL